MKHFGTDGIRKKSVYFDEEYLKKIASERERQEQERERLALEDRQRMLTSGGDRYFYKKKRNDSVWWLKESGGDHKFSFDKETVFDLMKDYPDKLTSEQKEAFDRENPYWAKRLQKKE